MRRSSGFSLFNIADVPYLLPFGQAAAEHKRGVRLNDTGVFLWELLKEDLPEEELLARYTARYGDSGVEALQLEADLRQFLNTLEHYGILEKAPHPLQRDNTCAGRRYFHIAGLTLLFCGSPQAFSGEFDAFEIPPASHVDQTLTVTGQPPLQHPNGVTLLRDPELVVLENESQYIFLFPSAPGIHEAHLSKDAADACYFCQPPYTETLRRDLFHAIRLSFLYLAQLRHMAVLHSASLLYRGKAWLFSGHSGAGKSTHTGLWKELYGVPLLNGDLNLLSMEDGKPRVHGLPWCGTSGICDTHSHPLGGILLVKKAPENRAIPLPPDKARLLVTQRLISPGWTETLLQKNLSFIDGLAPHILICRLHCTKEPEAAAVGRETIDNYLDGGP